MRLILFFTIFFSILPCFHLVIAPPEPVEQRGGFHDEGLFDYEEAKNNSDYATRMSSDDDKVGSAELIEKVENKQKDEEEDRDSSDISEERNRDTVDQELVHVIAAGKSGKVKPVQIIDAAFNDRKTFSCPRIKDQLVTGTSVADISPEDIKIIGAMGDILATGSGLWPMATIEFRGASFPIGGDSTIDGLVTIPNILREFSPNLVGVSHGMGKNLPDHQLNVAQTGATTKDLPAQANELVRRLKKWSEYDYLNKWVMIIITIGTEELCLTCNDPHYASIEEAIRILQVHVPKALVILLGPIHVSAFHQQKANLLKNRCECTRNETDGYMYDLSRKWEKSFRKVQKFVENGETSRPTFGMITYPMITITSRYPNGLFISKSHIINRRAHNYATKWLWNRMIGGDLYNLSSATLSADNYFCPSVGCPYFRTYANADICRTLSYAEAEEMNMEIRKGVLIKPRRTTKFHYTLVCVILFAALCTVCVLGTFFYQWSKVGDHGRFEIVEEPQKKLEEAQKEEQKALLTRQNTRAQSELALNSQLAPAVVGRHKSFLGTIDEDRRSPL